MSKKEDEIKQLKKEIHTAQNICDFISLTLEKKPVTDSQKASTHKHVIEYKEVCNKRFEKLKQELSEIHITKEDESKRIRLKKEIEKTEAELRKIGVISRTFWREESKKNAESLTKKINELNLELEPIEEKFQNQFNIEKRLGQLRDTRLALEAVILQIEHHHGLTPAHLKGMENEVAMLQQEKNKDEARMKYLILHNIPLYETQVTSIQHGIDTIKELSTIIREESPFTEDDIRFRLDNLPPKESESGKKALEEVEKLRKMNPLNVRPKHAQAYKEIAKILFPDKYSPEFR